MHRLPFFSILLLFYFQLQSQEATFLKDLIEQNKNHFGPWAQAPEQYEIQLIYTRIDRDAENKPSFTSFTFNLDPQRYFYPASTVKMPAAFLALEKLNQLKIIGLDKHTPMRVGAGTPPQTPVVTDTSAADYLPSVAHYIRKIFLVSDNDAFNRLYEFLGQAYFNKKLVEKGYSHSRIIHRLSAPAYDPESNRYTNPVTFYRYDTMRYYQGEVYSQAAQQLQLKDEKRGAGYLNDAGELIREPFDFSQKNFVSLQDLHDMLQAVIFPEAVPISRRFDLTEEDYRFLYQAMTDFPKESASPRYDQPDNYVKFWMFGDSTTESIPTHIRILNKVGWAYGFLTDVAYIIDLENDVEFLLAGAIHANENQIYNDGVYEYKTIGLPFFTELGKAIYELELKRARIYPPDLSRFEFGDN